MHENLQREILLDPRNPVLQKHLPTTILFMDEILHHLGWLKHVKTL